MTNRIKLLAATALMTAGLAAAAAVSAAEAGRGKGMFDRIDRNGDGSISRDEAQAARAAHFARLDANGDGSITVEEFQAQANSRFSRMDLDNDGQVTREEAQQARKAWHDKKSQPSD